MSGTVGAPASIMIGHEWQTAILLVPPVIFILVLRLLGGFATRHAPSQEAAARARALLRDVLSESELRQIERRGWLEVPSPHWAGRRYRIPRFEGPVEVIDTNGDRHWLCVVPLAPLPKEELPLIHKLWIEADEREYLRRANRLTSWCRSTQGRPLPGGCACW